MIPQPQPEPAGSTSRTYELHRRALTRRALTRLAGLEGCQVSVALDDGSRIDDCQLVSGGRHGVETLWLFINGADRFIPLERVVDIWEASCPAA